MLTNQVIFEAIDSILKRSVSDQEKAQAILSFMNANGVEVWQIKNATGYTEDQINDFLALAAPPSPLVTAYGTIALPDDQPIYYPSFVDLINAPDGVGGPGWNRGPGSYEYFGAGTPLAYNATFVDRLFYGYFDDYQRALGQQVLAIINNAIVTKTNPSAALETINQAYDGFASKMIADIGLGGQMRMYTQNANFYGGGPSPDIQAKIARTDAFFRDIPTTFADGTAIPTGPKAVTPGRVVADAGATKPPLSPADVRTGITTPVVKVPVTPSETPTPTPVSASNVLPLALAAVAFYLFG
jgi:hypothetical protein